jgi:hypothetical protein
MFTFLVDLRKNGPKAPWFFLVAEACINNEGIGPVSSWVIDNWL